MATVNIDGLSDLSALVEKALAGEEVILAKAGKAVARVAPLDKKFDRKPGRLKGKIWISEDFDAPLPPDIARAFGAEE